MPVQTVARLFAQNQGLPTIDIMGSDGSKSALAHEQAAKIGFSSRTTQYLDGGEQVIFRILHTLYPQPKVFITLKVLII